MSENGEIYTASKNFTLPPALTALTNFNSGLTSELSHFDYSFLLSNLRKGIYCVLHILHMLL